ncbi:MAG: hypothetical protein IJM27_10480 [Eubacterium sp.]|nr:hypothetical protein [Eubacterium sp.]
MRKFYGKVKCGILVAGLAMALSVGTQVNAAESDAATVSEGSSTVQEQDDDTKLTGGAEGTTNATGENKAEGNDPETDDVDDAEADDADADDADDADDSDADDADDADDEEADETDVSAEQDKTTSETEREKGGSTVQSVAASEGDKAQDTAKEGFFKDGDYTYYRDAKGNLVKASLVTVGEKQYYMDAKGRMLVSKNVVVNGVGYRANAKGVLSTKSGWMQVGSKWYFTEASGKLCKSMWVTNKYYLGADGVMATKAVVYHDNNYYYVNGKGEWVKTKGWITWKDEKYYIKSNGLIANNEPLKIGDRWFCFGEEAIPLKNQLVKINKVLYYLTEDGGTPTKAAWFKFNKKWYYAEKTGEIRVNKLVLSGDEKYYVGSDGVMVKKKIVKADGKMYYVKSSGRIRTQKGWITVDGKKYLVDKGGAFRTNNFVKSSSKKIYYLGSDGLLVKGKIVIHEDKAYYVKKNGLVAYFKGWKKVNGIWYYGLGQNGLKRNAIQTSAKKQYFLNSEGKMVVSDGVVCDGKAYKANKSGVLKAITGWFKSEGKWYRASSSGTIIKDRIVTVSKKDYYLDKNGVMMANGFFYYGKKLYYAEKSGAIRKKSGWFHVGENTYYSHSSGAFYHSVSKKIKGKRYYFNAQGVLVETNADYYDPTAISDTSWTEINGRRYHLDKNGNIDSWLGIDVSAWQDDIDWEKVASDGIDFAFIRVGGRFGKTGEIYDDSLGVENIKAATKAGIPVGVYFFTQAITVDEVLEEVKYTLDRIKGLDVTLPVVIDSENMAGGRHGTIDPQTRTDIIKAWCEAVTDAGYNAAYYAGMAWCVDGYVDVTQLTEYMHWCAQYWIRNQCDDYGVPYQIWQYSDSGSVDGINGKVDMNIWYRVH